MGGRIFCLFGLSLAAAACVESGNYGWDLGRWEPPLVAEPQVEAFRGVHEGRIGLACAKGGEPALFIDTWRPLMPEGPPTAATLTYRIGEREFTAPGRLEPRSFRIDPKAMPDLVRQLADADEIEALVPLANGGVYPVTFDVSDFSRALEWVRAECRQL